ncbi:hypothetical protein WJX84_003837 [Apatococcus fuscideae]|uniref:AAA+ ATPase domain-containing protein n=1 Tax=Apatococcus fuscideae TaxID=2026836 RepID=A0AAW1SXD5_9CHLO
MLWVDKYRPRRLQTLILNKHIGEHLTQLVATGDCPHILFYGSPGVGKKTLVIGLLHQIYGDGVEKIRVETKPWKIQLPSRNLEVELTTLSSNYHVEMNPSDVGNNDRHVVQEIIKDMAKSRPLDIQGQRSFKVLVLNEVDRLSKDAQHSLRRTMEKYSSACRLILICNNVSKVIDPVRSRCLCIRVAAPSQKDIMQMCQHVAGKEGLKLPEGLNTRIAAASDRNLRRALLMLETCQAAKYPFSDDQPVQLTDWELYIQEIASDILGEQSPKRLFVVRGKLYELLTNCIPPELILRRLMLELVKKLDDELKHQAAQLAAFYEHRLQEGQKHIFHLEAFVAKFMSEYKNWALSAFG